MCGIAGLLAPPGWRGKTALVATNMGAALRHRGPDSDGIWAQEEAGIALAHRRLAIVDLSPLGHQPMESRSGRYVIAYNGEIYNFRALRAELEAAGAQFAGTSDTEVLLALIEARGLEGALHKLAGMFAIALWDQQERALHLVRDRLGKKPLFVGIAGGAICFGSELKALSVVPGLDRTIDRDALACMLRRQYVPSPLSIWRDVIKVPPGMRIALQAGEAKSARDLRRKLLCWWSAADHYAEGQADPLSGPDGELLDRLEDVLETAVAERMVADVPVGAFLSGGVDSSLVVAMMQRASGRRVRTFTVGFGEQAYDESAKARAVAAFLGTDHVELRVSAEQARDIIPALPDIQDEPFADASLIPSWHIARLARQEVTVCLSGDGGDESFAGYGRYLLADRLKRKLGAVPGPLRSGAAAVLGLLPLGALDFVAGLAGQDGQTGYRGGASGDRLRKLLPLIAASDSDRRYEALLDIGSAQSAVGNSPWPIEVEGQGLDSLHRMMLFDTRSYLPDDVLAKVDRASMAVALEARAPLLDHRVVELAARLPSRLKLRSGEGKWALRRLLERHLPLDLVDKGKAGFGVPIADWLRGPLRPWAEELLDERRLKSEGLLQPAIVRSWWAQHQTGRRNFAPQLWSILMFQAWQDRWMTGPTAPMADVSLSAA